MHIVPSVCIIKRRKISVRVCAVCRIAKWSLAVALLLMGAVGLADSKKTSRDVANLFSDEIQQVTVKMKWRGERLTDDTLYAAALTGV
jgi:hypothetical protein